MMPYDNRDIQLVIQSGESERVEFKKVFDKEAIETLVATEPSIIPDIELVTLDNKQVVAIHVGEFPVKPVACRDRYFKRVANSNHRLSLPEIANLHLQSLQLSRDSYVDMSSTLTDLDRGEIRMFLKRVKEGGRFRVGGEWQTVLEKLGYLKDRQPTHAAMLLFGKNDPPFALHIGRFKTP